MSIHVMSRGAMFRFIKKCECIKKRKKGKKEKESERESDVNTHAILKKKKKDGRGLLTYICPICTCRDADASASWEPGCVCLNYSRPSCSPRKKGRRCGSLHLTNFSGSLEVKDNNDLHDRGRAAERCKLLANQARLLCTPQQIKRRGEREREK